MIATMLRRLGTTSLLFTAALGCAPAHAESSSAWDGDARSAARLIAGTAPSQKGTGWRAGVEIRLAPGWKTYWRYPGDSGVPPRFDFAQSVNVKSAALAYPYPHRFDDGGGQSLGYKGGVIFPLRVVPEDPAQPATLRLKLDYAVCEKLCVPADASVELTLPAGSAEDARTEAALAAAETRVPKSAAVGDNGALSIRGVRQEPGSRTPRVIVEVAAPPGTPVDLFAEGPSPDWALPIPARMGDAVNGVQRFAFDLDGLPPGAQTSGAVLTLTAVAGDQAIEAKARLN
jgi:DsbC/DsbD-like thiol-disulfide interchange protein